MKKPSSQYSIINHSLNNYGGLKWTGTFWTVSKKRCAKLDPYSTWFENKKHNCKEKGYPITLEYPEQGSDYSFTVTDEKAQQMKEDGRIDQLQQMNVIVHDGADPLYFDWHNKIAKELKNTSKRTNTQYMTLYPYLELPTLTDINFETGENALDYLSQKGFEFYTGESIPRRHEATLRFINKNNDVELLKNAKERYENVLDNMRQANNNPTQAGIEIAFNKGMENLGNNPVTGILNFGYEKIKRLVRVMTNINEAELEEINKRLKKLKPFEIKQGNFLPNIPTVKDNQKASKYVIPAITILTTMTILSFFK